jgi:transcriptional regulator with XRE-family HTH domain
MQINIDLIEQLRKNKNYSMEQMAEKLNYRSRATYCNKVKGHRNFTLKDIVAISMIFNKDISELIIK